MTNPNCLKCEAPNMNEKCPKCKADLTFFPVSSGKAFYLCNATGCLTIYSIPPLTIEHEIQQLSKMR